MTNPFENETDTYHALINDEEQYSLWPTFLPVPDGCTLSTKRTVARPVSTTSTLTGPTCGQEAADLSQVERLLWSF